MTLVVDKFRLLLPSRTKSSPSGWQSFNAPCCSHRGHKADTRKRGGVMISDSIVYNCFNCKFSTGWAPGNSISPKFKSLLQWMGASDDIIKEMTFEALKTESADYVPQESKTVLFTEKELPEGSMPLLDWCHEPYLSTAAELLSPVLNYLTSRKFDPFSGDFWWSPSPGYENRVIIPFRWQGKIVGSTARKVTEGRPKYISDQHPFFVFNVDNQIDEYKYTFVVEGPFDALSIGGVALLTNEVSDQQAMIINSIGKQVIVIPDQDRAGSKLIAQARDLGWKVSFPTWEDDIKDVADAVSKYGKLFVIVDAIMTATDNAAKLEIERKKLLAKLDRLEN